MVAARRTTEVRKNELVDAALHVIATRGIAALTTRALAEQVGLTTGALFRHFPSLDALLEEVVGRVEAVLDATYPPAHLPPRERLERFVEARSTAVGAQLGILRLVLSEQFLLALPGDGSRRLSRCVQRTRAFVQGCIEEAQRDGTVRADVAPEALASIVMGTVQMLALAQGPAGRRARAALSTRRALQTLLTPQPARIASQRRGR